MSEPTKNELLLECEKLNLKKYKSKTKKELLDLLEEAKKSNNVVAIDKNKKINKKNKGQFYTTNNDYILEGLSIPSNITNIIEPFAG